MAFKNILANCLIQKIHTAIYNIYIYSYAFATPQNLRISGISPVSEKLSYRYRFCELPPPYFHTLLATKKLCTQQFVLYFVF